MILTSILISSLLITSQANAPAQAGFVLKNETNNPIVVQIISIFNGQLLRDRPYTLSPGESTPTLQIPGNKTVSIGEGKNPIKPSVQLPIPPIREETIFAVVGNDKQLRLDPRKK